MNNSKRVHIWISGRVQGVGFRYFCRQKAVSLGLTGWVRNRGDGRVELVLEGDPDDVDEALKVLKRGPSASRIENFMVMEESASDSFDSFTIEPFGFH